MSAKRQRVKSFLGWCNFHLAKRNGLIHDLRTDFADGVALATLLEVLSTKRPSGTVSSPTLQVQRTNNLIAAVTFMKNENVRMYNITPEAIAKGDLDIILAMVWHLIIRYQLVDERTANSVALSRLDATARTRLLDRLNDYLRSGPSISSVADPPYPIARDFSASFADGAMFCAICHRAKPEKLDWSIVETQAAETNAKMAFEILRNEWGLPDMLDPSMFASSPSSSIVPDERSVMAFVVLALDAIGGGRSAVAGSETAPRKRTPHFAENDNEPHAIPQEHAFSKKEKKYGTQERVYSTSRGRRVLKKSKSIEIKSLRDFFESQPTSVHHKSSAALWEHEVGGSSQVKSSTLQIIDQICGDAAEMSELIKQMKDPITGVMRGRNVHRGRSLSDNQTSTKASLSQPRGVTAESGGCFEARALVDWILLKRDVFRLHRIEDAVIVGKMLVDKDVVRSVDANELFAYNSQLYIFVDDNDADSENNKENVTENALEIIAEEEEKKKEEEEDEEEDIETQEIAEERENNTIINNVEPLRVEETANANEFYDNENDSPNTNGNEEIREENEEESSVDSDAGEDADSSENEANVKEPEKEEEEEEVKRGASQEAEHKKRVIHFDVAEDKAPMNGDEETRVKAATKDDHDEEYEADGSGNSNNGDRRRRHQDDDPKSRPKIDLRSAMTDSWRSTDSILFVRRKKYASNSNANTHGNSNHPQYRRDDTMDTIIQDLVAMGDPSLQNNNNNNNNNSNDPGVETDGEGTHRSLTEATDLSDLRYDSDVDAAVDDIRMESAIVMGLDEDRDLVSRSTGFDRIKRRSIVIYKDEDDDEDDEENDVLSSSEELSSAATDGDDAGACACLDEPATPRFRKQSKELDVKKLKGDVARLSPATNKRAREPLRRRQRQGRAASNAADLLLLGAHKRNGAKMEEEDNEEEEEIEEEDDEEGPYSDSEISVRAPSPIFRIRLAPPPLPPLAQELPARSDRLPLPNDPSETRSAHREISPRSNRSPAIGTANHKTSLSTPIIVRANVNGIGQEYANSPAMNIAASDGVINNHSNNNNNNKDLKQSTKRQKRDEKKQQKKRLELEEKKKKKEKEDKKKKEKKAEKRRGFSLLRKKARGGEEKKASTLPATLSAKATETKIVAQQRHQHQPLKQQQQANAMVEVAPPVTAAIGCDVIVTTTERAVNATNNHANAGTNASASLATANATHSDANGDELANCRRRAGSQLSKLRRYLEGEKPQAKLHTVEEADGAREEEEETQVLALVKDLVLTAKKARTNARTKAQRREITDAAKRLGAATIEFSAFLRNHRQDRDNDKVQGKDSMPAHRAPDRRASAGRPSLSDALLSAGRDLVVAMDPDSPAAKAKRSPPSSSRKPPLSPRDTPASVVMATPFLDELPELLPQASRWRDSLCTLVAKEPLDANSLRELLRVIIGEARALASRCPLKARAKKHQIVRDCKYFASVAKDYCDYGEGNIGTAGTHSSSATGARSPRTKLRLLASFDCLALSMASVDEWLAKHKDSWPSLGADNDGELPVHKRDHNGNYAHHNGFVSPVAPRSSASVSNNDGHRSPLPPPPFASSVPIAIPPAATPPTLSIEPADYSPVVGNGDPHSRCGAHPRRRARFLQRRSLSSPEINMPGLSPHAPGASPFPLFSHHAHAPPALGGISPSSPFSSSPSSSYSTSPVSSSPLAARALFASHSATPSSSLSSSPSSPALVSPSTSPPQSPWPLSLSAPPSSSSSLSPRAIPIVETLRKMVAMCKGEQILRMDIAAFAALTKELVQHVREIASPDRQSADYAALLAVTTRFGASSVALLGVVNDCARLGGDQKALAAARSKWAAELRELGSALRLLPSEGAVALV